MNTRTCTRPHRTGWPIGTRAVLTLLVLLLPSVPESVAMWRDLQQAHVESPHPVPVTRLPDLVGAEVPL